MLTLYSQLALSLIHCPGVSCEAMRAGLLCALLADKLTWISTELAEILTCISALGDIA